MAEDLPIQALKEEIGKPELFTGRKKDLGFFLDWVDLVNDELGHSHVILARKRRGKTALVQRLFNHIYTRANPKIIPFYIRVDEGRTTQMQFSQRLFCSLISQYLGHKRRDPKLIRKTMELNRLKKATDDEDLLDLIHNMIRCVADDDSGGAWELARECGHTISSLKDERIIQIIDEFQFLNDRIYVRDDFKTLIELGSFYQRTGSSKVSPQIITGSYIGWLSQIVGKMVGRYRRYYLEPLTHEEALSAIYNYSSVLKREISDESAAYMAEACFQDPFYIAQTFQSQCPKRNLTSPDHIREILQFETSSMGEITGMWMDYLQHAFSRINDRNAKKIVLYLARHGVEERNRRQIADDLQLDMSDEDLEKKLDKLVHADIIKRGVSQFYFRGLGDPIFEMVFRKEYQDEIDQIQNSEIEEDLNRQLKSLKGKTAHYKGVAAESRLINRLIFLGLKKASPQQIFYGAPQDLRLGPFATLAKESFHLDQEQRVEVDICGRAAQEEDWDLIVEVKDHETMPGKAHVQTFIEIKTVLSPHLSRPTAFLFYSEQGVTKTQAHQLLQAGIMYTDGTRLGNV